MHTTKFRWCIISYIYQYWCVCRISYHRSSINLLLSSLHLIRLWSTIFVNWLFLSPIHWKYLWLAVVRKLISNVCFGENCCNRKCTKLLHLWFLLHLGLPQLPVVRNTRSHAKHLSRIYIFSIRIYTCFCILILKPFYKVNKPLSCIIDIRITLLIKLR